MTPERCGICCEEMDRADAEDGVRCDTCGRFACPRCLGGEWAECCKCESKRMEANHA